MRSAATIFEGLPKFTKSNKRVSGNKGGRAIRISPKTAQSAHHTNVSQKIQQDKEKLHAIAEKSNEILCGAKAIWPFDLFPDEITVETNQVNIVQRDFFISETILSVPIRNIADVYVETSPFFASLKLIDQAFKSEPITIRYLRKDDALKVRRVIQGIIVANTNQINVATLDRRFILPPAESIGRAAGYEYDTPQKYEPE